VAKKIKEKFDANFEDLTIGDKIVLIHNENDKSWSWYHNEMDKKPESGVMTIKTFVPDSDFLYVEEDCPCALDMMCVLKIEEEEAA